MKENFMNPSPLTTQIDLGGMQHIVIFIGLSIGALVWFIKMSHVSVAARLLLAYLLVYTLFMLEYPHAIFGDWTTAYRAQAGQTLAEFMFTACACVFIMPYIERLLKYVVGFVLVCVWLGEPGILGAISFQTAFCALAIPFLPLPLSVLVVVTALTHHGSTALLIIGAQCFAVALKHPKFNKATPFVIAALYTSAYYMSGAMFDGGERLAKYSKFMTYLFTKWEWIIFGVGPGTFTWTSILLDEYKAPLFLQMHSDWLQIFWELGAVGFALSVFLFGQTVKRAWNRTYLLAATLGAGAFMATYYPLRHYPTALLTVYIFLTVELSYKEDSIVTRLLSSRRQGR